MFRNNKMMIVAFALTSLLALFSEVVYATFPKLSTNLVGAPIGNLTPQGTAQVDQSKLPSAPARLSLRVQNVDLPDGTKMDVIIGALYVGSFTISGKQGSLSTTFVNQVGRNTPIYLQVDGVTILYGGTPWQI